MNQKFKNLKNQLNENWKNLENRFLESNSFNHLKEKYHSLDVKRQKLIKYLLIFFIFSAIVYFPLSYFFSSVVSWQEFKEKRSLSLEILKMRNKISSSVFRYSQVQLKNKIQRTINQYSNANFQIEDKRMLFQEEESIEQIDFDIHLKHMNIKQAVRLGTELHHLDQAYLSSITMEENKEFPKHYDVTYKISAFVLKNNTTDFYLRKKEPTRRRKTPSKSKIEPVKYLKKDNSKTGNSQLKKKKKVIDNMKENLNPKDDKGDEKNVKTNPYLIPEIIELETDKTSSTRNRD